MPDTYSSVVYNGKRLIPAPLAAFSRQIQRSGAGTAVAINHTVTLNGKLVACKGWDFTGAQPELYTGSGYPNDDSDCCKFYNILEMQEKLRQHFNPNSGDYHWLEITDAPSAPPRKWLARVSSIDFKEGQWVETCDYTITFELQDDSANSSWDGLDNITTESWEIQHQEESGGIYSVIHNITAQCKNYATNDGVSVLGWTRAKTQVNAKLATYRIASADGIDYAALANTAGCVVQSPIWTAYNYIRQASVDELGGEYRVTETWTLSPSQVIRTIAVEGTTQENGEVRVRVSGNFKMLREENCLAEEDNVAWTEFTAWSEGNGPYNLANIVYATIRCSEGNALGTVPSSKSVTRNYVYRGSDESRYTEQARTVDFSFEFSDIPKPVIDISVAIKSQQTGDCATIITVDGSVQGRGCDGYTEASDAYLNIDFSSYVTADYRLINDTVTRSERKQSVSFSREYSDKFPSGYREVRSITETLDCNTRGNDGQALSTWTVHGDIEGVCDISFATLLTYLPTADTFALLCGSCDLSRSSITKDETNRKITYEYSFNPDVGDVRIETDITNKRNANCKHLKTVQINIVGKGCSDLEAANHARNALEALNSDDYSDGYTLLTQSTMLGTTGKASASYEFSDEFTDGIKRVENTVESWDCSQRSSNGTALTIYTVDGTIEGTCGYDVSATVVEDPVGFTGFINRRTVNRFPNDNKVTYQFVIESDLGLARVEADIITKIGPDECGVTKTTCNITIQGKGCSDAQCLANAVASAQTYTPSFFVGTSVGHLISLVTTKSRSGKLSIAAEYSSQTDATTSITITDSQDSSDCTTTKRNISGQIKGHCVLNNSGEVLFTAIQNADDTYDTLDLSSYIGAGFVVSTSKTRNEHDGIISFSKEVLVKPEQYTHEQTVTVRYEKEAVCNTVIVSGVINPVCDFGVENGTDAVTAGETAWATIRGTLAGVAAAADATATDLKTSSVSKNKLNGKINYDYTYTCQLICKYVEDSVSESLDINHEYGVPVIAQIPILGKAGGPIIQDKRTLTAETCSINFTVRFRPTGSLTIPVSNTVVDDILSSVFTTVGTKYKTKDIINWNPCTGTYSRTVAQIVEKC